MRTSKTLKKLRANKTVRICGLGHFFPPFVRHAANFGFDCLWFDLEHRAMDDREVQALLAFAHLADIDCMVRAPTLEVPRLYRYLEDGASGLMIPHVSTAQRARELVQSVKFPPLGNRGIDGAGLDGDFFLAAGSDYTEQANRETFLVVQIETPQAVENVDEIAAVDGVDGLFVGPADLELRLRQSPNGMNLDEAAEVVTAVAAKHGKPWGRPVGSPEHLEQLHAQGAQLMAFGGDFGAMIDMFERHQAIFDKVCGKG